MEINIRRFLVLLLILGLSSHFCFSQKNDLDNKFLMVLDVQRHDTDKLESDSSFQTFIESLNVAIGHFNTKNIIYIMGIHLQLNLSLTFPNLYISLNTEAMQLYDRMSLVNKNIFLKEEAMGNAFNIEGLNNFLKKNNAKEIILIGLLAEKCIYQSCIGGLDKAYNMYIIPEAIIGESQESKDKVIKELTEKGIKTLNLNELKYK